MAEYDCAIELDPECADAYECRASAYCEIEDYDKAGDDWNESLRLSRSTAVGYGYLGLSCYQKGELDKAIEYYNKAMEQSDDPELYRYRGMALLAKYEYDAALADFDQALSLGSEYSEVNFYKIRAYLGRGSDRYESRDYDHAIEDFGRAIRQLYADGNEIVGIPTFLAEAYKDRGLAYYQKGDYERSLVDLKKAESYYIEFAR